MKLNRMGSLLLSLLLAAAPLAACGSIAEEASGSMSLLAINVRKADCLLLRSGESAYLIDTGRKKTADQVLKVLAENGVTRLTGIIVTHTDSDHVGGLASLMESDLTVENVYTSAYYVLEKKTHPAEKALKKTGLTLQYLKSGDSLPLDGGSLDVLGPLSENPTKENNNSVVLLATGGGGTMLLTGDMEFPEEAELLDSGLIPHADVLKVADHAEKDATSEALLQAVTPKVAVISTNTEDEPDTPASRVLKALARWNVTVYETQKTENGVLITLTGGEITVELQ